MATAGTIKVLICDDHPVVRTGVRDMLEPAPDIAVIGEAGTAEEAIEAAFLRDPDVVFMDLKMPEMGGVEATRQISRRLPRTKVVILTGVDTEAGILRAIEAGALGYRLKGDQPHELVDAARRAAIGDSSLSPSAAKRLVGRHRQDQSDAALTDRQVEVLRAIGRGLTTRNAIAEDLRMSPGSVKQHLLDINERLGTNDKLGAFVEALKRGIVELEP